MLSKFTQKANVCDEYWFYVSHFFSLEFSNAKLGAAGINLGLDPNLHKRDPGPTMKATWLKSSLYVEFLSGTTTSKDKFHWRKRKATIPLRNKLQQILAPSQLMEDFLKLLKLPVSLIFKPSFPFSFKNIFLLMLLFQFHIFQLYILSSSFYSPSLIHFSFTYLTFYLLDFSVLS